MNEVLDKNVGELELSVRAINALRNNDISTVGELTKWSPKALKRLPNVGRSTVKELNQALGFLNLNLRDMKKEKIEEKLEENSVLKNLNYEIITKAKEAADISFNKINSQKNYNFNEVGRLFSEHQNIMNIYRDSILGLWEK